MVASSFVYTFEPVGSVYMPQALKYSLAQVPSRSSFSNLEVG
jgi:hypothetical protein